MREGELSSQLFMCLPIRQKGEVVGYDLERGCLVKGKEYIYIRPLPAATTFSSISSPCSGRLLDAIASGRVRKGETAPPDHFSSPLLGATTVAAAAAASSVAATWRQICSAVSFCSIKGDHLPFILAAGHASNHDRQQEILPHLRHEFAAFRTPPQTLGERVAWNRKPFHSDNTQWSVLGL